MALQKADATITGEQNLTDADILEIQETLNISDPTKIYTSKGDIYSIEGLTEIQAGQLLQTAVDGVGNVGWVYVPSGNYDNDLGDTLTIKDQREINVFGLGRSDVIIKNTFGFHALVIDGTGLTVYRGTIRNIALFTPRQLGLETGDAIHVKGSFVTSFKIFNVHIQQSDRHAIFIDSDVVSISIEAQVTDADISSGIREDTVHMLSGHSVKISQGRSHKYYFGANCFNGVVYEDYLRAGSEISIVDDGENNKVVKVDNYQPYKVSDKKNYLPFGGSYLPLNLSSFNLPLNKIDNGIVFDYSKNGKDLTETDGTLSFISDDTFYQVPNFDGTNSIGISGTPSINLGSDFAFYFWIKPTTNSQGVFFESGAIEFQINSSNRYSVSFAWDNSTFRTITSSFEAVYNEWTPLGIIYKDGVASIKNLNTGQETSTSDAGKNLTIFSGSFFIGKRFSNFFNGNIANFVIATNVSEELNKAYYNQTIKSMITSVPSLSRDGSNNMKAPLNYAPYTTTERDALVGVQIGGTIFNTTTDQIETWNGSSWV